jgi:histidinol-phosphate aminotransferase
VQPLHGHLSSTHPPEPLPGVAGVERWPEAGPEQDGHVSLDRNERLGPFPEWFIDELRERLTSTLASTYPSQMRLANELAASLGVPRESVFVTSGTDAALRSVHLAYVGAGDAVVRLEPTYAMVPVYAQMFGARDVAIGYDEHLALDPDELLDAVEPGVRLVVIANPNQPTGTVLDLPFMEALVDRCAAAGALLVFDEAYYGFTAVTALPLVGRSENLVVLRTFSKAAGLAGLRVGYAVGAPSIIHALSAVRAAGEVNSLALEAARLVVAHPEIVEDYVRVVAAGRAVLEERARSIGIEPLATEANFLLLRLPRRLEPAIAAAALHDRGYIVRGPFSAPGLAGCIRVTLGPPELMEQFAVALAGVIRA